MRLKKSVVLLFFLGLFSMFIFNGCNITESVSDDSTKDAEIERGLDALDSGNYSRAEEIFEKLKNNHPNDNQLKSYYSSAVAGSAGLDTYNLMETIDEMDKAGESGDTIGLVGKTLTDSDKGTDPELSLAEIKNKEVLFEKSMNALLEISDTDYDELSGKKTTQSRKSLSIALSDKEIAALSFDERVQLGLMALNHSILIISDILSNDALISEIKLSKTEFNTIYSIYKPLDGNDYSALLKKLSLDIDLLEIAISAIKQVVEEEDNDISQEFELFKSKIDNGNVDDGSTDQDESDGVADDNIITIEELEYYLDHL